MRNEVPVDVPDPFLFVEHDGERRVVLTSFEVDRLRSLGFVADPFEAFGLDELLAQGLSRDEARLEAAVNACLALGVTEAVVPRAFPLDLAERLRRRHLSVEVAHDVFERRRRVKTPAQLAAIEHVTAGAERAMATAAAMLATAVERQGRLYAGRELLTSELLRAAIKRSYFESDLLAEDIIVAHGSQIYGHDPGHGEIRAGEPIVIDLAPCDPDSGFYSDMTRTFVVGEPDEELVEYHALVLAALGQAKSVAAAGVRSEDVYRDVCEFFQRHGFETELTKQPGDIVRSGFFHGLGHGVGLAVHEPPYLARSNETLVRGDVATLEPGLYREGYGGCRLEDLVVIAGDSCRTLTRFPYDLDPAVAIGAHSE